MSLLNSKKESKRSNINITTLFFIILLLLFVIIILVNLMLGTITWKSFSIEVINSLIGVMLPLLLFNIVFEHLTKSHNNLELTEKIVDSIMLNKNVLERFTNESKKMFIKAITESILGKNEGNMLFSTLMVPYLENKYNFRRNFRYYISYIDNLELSKSFEHGEITFKNEDYNIVQEELNFVRSMNNYNLKQRKINAGFSYGFKELEPLFKGEGVFFRENFLILDEHMVFLRNLNEADLTSFVKEVLNFKFELDDVELEYKVTSSPDGFYLNFEIDDRVEITVGKEYKFKYTFQMPQLKTEKKFIAIVSEPTEYVNIFFTHTNRDVKITAIPFFDDSEALEYLPNNIVKIELGTWVLPRSGVVFTWDN